MSRVTYHTFGKLGTLRTTATAVSSAKKSQIVGQCFGEFEPAQQPWVAPTNVLNLMV